MYKNKKSIATKLITTSITAAIYSSAASADINSNRINDLQRQIDELRSSPSKNTAGSPQVSFPGQYRINFYSADNDDGNNNQTAARVRIRQSIDLKFDKKFKTHLQFQLNHTPSNVTAAGDKDGNDVRVRHAVMEFTSKNGTRTRAGIVPLTGYYNDAMYSQDWAYNPVAVEVFSPLGKNTLHAFAANFNEGIENSKIDDSVHYQVDFATPITDGDQLIYSMTGINMLDAAGTQDGWHYNYGIAGKFNLGSGMKLNGFLMASSTDATLLGSASDASGYATRLELNGQLGNGRFGLLGSYASGEDDGSGFLMPMAFAKTYGYWGYTGILTVQGPTDTGFDGDGVNISNNGYGLTSFQFKYTMPLTDNLDGYFAAGWYGNTEAAGRNNQLGTDLLAMGSYHLSQNLSLDMGAAYAQLKDSVSGYWQGVQGGAGFNQAAGENRSKFVLFGRLQAAF